MPDVSRALKCASLGVIALMITACTPSLSPVTIIITPTQAPTVTSSSEVTPAIAIVAQTATTAPTLTSTLTETPTVVASSTPTAMPTFTQTATQVPPTQQVAVVAVATQTVEPTLAPTTAPDAIVSSADGLNLRLGPGTNFEPPLVLLEPNTPLKIIAQSPDLLWYQVETFTGQQGWAYSKLMTVYQQPPNLPIIDVAATQSAVIVVQAQGQGAAPVNLSGSGTVITDRMRQVFQLGQQMGNNPRVFIKVGDSVTDQQAFMVGFGTGQYNLGPYTSLQATINYFSAEAFARDSLAAEPAFNSGSVMDSLRMPEEGLEVCPPPEKPLECEIRVMKPAFAVILFGGNEVRSMELDQFLNQMQQLIDLTTSRGVIPILNTFPHAENFHPNAVAFNEALRAMAAENQIPLIDLEVAVRPLPNGGIEAEDGFHLSMRGIRTAPDNWIYLNGEEKQLGATLRDLLTLQMLDSLRIGLGLN